MGDDFTSSKIKCNELKIAPPWFPTQMNEQNDVAGNKEQWGGYFLHVQIIK